MKTSFSGTPNRSTNPYKRPFLCGLLALGLLGACGGGDDGGGADLSLTPELQKGSYDLTGTVSLATPFTAATRVSLLLTNAEFGATSARLTAANAFENQTVGGGKSQLTFAVRGIKAGKYLISVVADTSMDGVIGEGDVGGYYGGTAAQPATYGKDAQVVTVVDRSLEGLDFGIGPVVCKAKVGQTCATDDDCRGTVCTQASGARFTTTANACDATKKCALNSCTLGTTPGTPSEAGCFGSP
jgi:hypothetical protein